MAVGGGKEGGGMMVCVNAHDVMPLCSGGEIVDIVSPSSTYYIQLQYNTSSKLSMYFRCIGINAYTYDHDQF